MAPKTLLQYFSNGLCVLMMFTMMNFALANVSKTKLDKIVTNAILYPWKTQWFHGKSALNSALKGLRSWKVG